MNKNKQKLYENRQTFMNDNYKTYYEIYKSLESISKSHRYMTDEDKFGELDVYEWNNNSFEIIDEVISPKDKLIYQDCESFAIRCINALVLLYGEEIKKDLKMMIGSWSGVGHGFFTFKALDEDGILHEYLWDNNLPCPLPLKIMLLTCDYKIHYVYSIKQKKFFKVLKNPLESMDYNGIKGSDILKISEIRVKG